MEKNTVLCIKINCVPSDLKSPCINLLRDKYNNTIFKDLYIKNVEDVIHKTGGKILNNGQIQFKIESLCSVINPCINTVYTLKITHINKMGALSKNELVTVFIPLQYYNNITPAIDSVYDIKIIGKRIEDSIVCVGKFV
jgi:hypothetical protein